MTTLPFRLLPLQEGQVDLAAAADDVRGLVVLDANGHRVGEVDDLIVDEAERRARLLVVASGGILGLGAQRHLVPVEAVAHVSDHVRLQHSGQAVPRTEDADSSIERGDYAAIYASYGCTPFWEATNSNSYFHDRQW
jgi:sporulation protein YlmC with PRC-barrel domain